MNSTIIFVRNVDEFVRVQKILFEAGFRWPSDGEEIDTYPVLYVRAKENGYISQNGSHMWENYDPVVSILDGGRLTLADAKRIKGAGAFSREVREMSVAELSEYISQKEGKIIEIKVKKD